MTNDETIGSQPSRLTRPGTFQVLASISTVRFALVSLLAAVLLASCSGAKLTLANYNKITLGMSKAQVEKILGPPTSVDKIDMFIFKKTTFRYEDGKKFAIITFKNDEVDSKDTNLNTNP